MLGESEPSVAATLSMMSPLATKCHLDPRWTTTPIGLLLLAAALVALEWRRQRVWYRAIIAHLLRQGDVNNWPMHGHKRISTMECLVKIA